MKRLLPFFLISFFFISCNTSPDKQFEKGLNFFEIDEYEKALSVFSEIIAEYNNHIVYPDSLYNFGVINYKLQEYDVAEETFLKILESDFNDLDEATNLFEAYKLYKNKSCILLSEIYIFKNDYIKALKYLDLARFKFKYSHFCGNELAEDFEYMNYLYAKCFIALDNYKKSIEYLVSGVIRGPGILSERSWERNKNQFIEIVKKNYKRNDFLSIFELSEETFNFKQGNNIYYPDGYVKVFENEIKIRLNRKFLAKNIEDFEVDDYKKLKNEDYEHAYIKSYREIYMDLINSTFKI